ncbi:hypothetical protein [Pseudogemmobacter bohemicus]|uniref:hypothetical protein n=1 Tax=Pseudogemmobacter bohemicus TaxID=2250708 RepID=UPI0013003BA8|nr:hypothetical protein [Pseudogemmobacter bohemicus]
MQRVTVAVSAEPNLMKGANHVHVLLSKAENFDTYYDPGWQDSDGNLYCVSSGLWSDLQIEGVTDPTIFSEVIYELMQIYPDIDMAAVAVAQDAFRWGGKAETSKITAIIGDDPFSALSEMGLRPLEESVED